MLLWLFAPRPAIDRRESIESGAVRGGTSLSQWTVSAAGAIGWVLECSRLEGVGSENGSGGNGEDCVSGAIFGVLLAECSDTVADAGGKFVVFFGDSLVAQTFEALQLAERPLFLDGFLQFVERFHGPLELVAEGLVVERVELFDARARFADCACGA